VSTWPTRGVPEMNTLLAVGGVRGSGAGVTGPTGLLVTARPGKKPLWATGVTSNPDQRSLIHRHQGIAPVGRTGDDDVIAQPAEGGSPLQVIFGIDVFIAAGEHLAHLSGTRNQHVAHPRGGVGGNVYPYGVAEVAVPDPEPAVYGGNSARARAGRVWHRHREADFARALFKGIHVQDQVNAVWIQQDGEDPRVPIELFVVVEVFTLIECCPRR
jgi:hypothetical protein